MAGAERAGETDDGLTNFAGEQSDVLRSFAEGGLSVEAAFASYDEVGVAEALSKADGIGDESGARPQLGAEEGDRGGA